MEPFTIIRKILPGLVIVGLLVGIGCSSSPSDSDDDGGGGNGDDPVTYELSVQANPSEGGSVDPETGTYEEGEEVEVTATAEEGWEFDGWSGDVSSTENPLVFAISQNTSLTASFVETETARAFSNELQFSDDNHTQVLAFGMKENALAGYDSGVDDEAPPEPPEGSFYAFFIIEGYNLYDDFRTIQHDQTIWEISFSPSSSNTMTISWDLSESNHAGNLSLVDDVGDASIEIDMETESSFEVSNSDLDKLYVVQQQ